jgi:hypothetical protein
MARRFNVQFFSAPLIVAVWTWAFAVLLEWLVKDDLTISDAPGILVTGGGAAIGAIIAQRRGKKPATNGESPH